MSPSVDPVAFVLGVIGLWIFACVVLLALLWLYGRYEGWRIRRRLAAAPVPVVLSRASLMELELDDVSWEGWPPGRP